MNPDEILRREARFGSPEGRELPGADCHGTLERRHPRAWLVYHLCERLTEAIVYLVVVFNPWAFGTTQPWSIWAMNIAGYALGVLLAAKWFLRLALGYRPTGWHASTERANSSRSRWLPPAMAVLTVVFLGYVLVSAVNACAAFHPTRFVIDYFDCILWLPHSYDRPATWLSFWEYLGLACTFWAVRDWLCGMSEGEMRANDGTGRGIARGARLEGQGDRAGRDWMPTRLKRVLMVLCINGTLVGVEGIVQRAAGSNKLLFLVQPRISKGTADQFGPYASRNNAAEYFNLLWPVCAGLACLSAQAAKRARREGALKPGKAHWLLAAGAVVMGACPLISSSRGGALVCLGLVPVTLVVLLTVPRAVSVGGKIGLGLLFAAALQIAVVLGWDSLQERFQSVFTDDLSGRLLVYKNAEKMVKDYPWFGSGAGSFESLYFVLRRQACRRLESLGEATVPGIQDFQNGKGRASRG